MIVSWSHVYLFTWVCSISQLAKWHSLLQKKYKIYEIFFLNIVFFNPRPKPRQLCSPSSVNNEPLPKVRGFYTAIPNNGCCLYAAGKGFSEPKLSAWGGSADNSDPDFWQRLKSPGETRGIFINSNLQLPDYMALQGAKTFPEAG